MSNGNHLFLLFCHCEELRGTKQRNPIKLIIDIVTVRNHVILIQWLHCHSYEGGISSNESRKGNTNISINYLM